MYEFKNISSYQTDLKNGNTTIEEVVGAYLAKIEAQKDLNAFVEVYAEEALAQAKMLDEARKSGKELKRLHGVIVAIKDVICYAGHRVTAASKILKGFESLYTASALQHLLDEEAVVIGNCNCDEFAMGSTNEHSAYGKVLNALDKTKVPGGSSGGSAVAVQAGLCMASLGSDTGGSVRQPADFCGIVGLKPTYGRISRYGLLAYASSFDQIGIFGNNVEDVALLLDIMAKTDEKDSTMLQNVAPSLSQIENAKQLYKFCYLDEALEHIGLDPEIKATYLAYFEKLRAEGHTVEKVDFDLLDYIVPTYYVLTTAEASSNLSRYDGVRYGQRTSEKTENIDEFYKLNRSEGFGIEVKRRIILGTFVLSTGYYDAYFAKAQRIRRMLVEKMQELFANHDAILMPTSPTTAMAIGQNDLDPLAAYLADIYTVFANLTGIPGISLPLFSHSNNLPFGLQILTKPENELTLLRISTLLMQQKNKC